MSFDFESIFDSAVDEGFGPSEDLTPGKYRGSIVSANFGESQAGDPKAGFLFKAAEGSVSAEGHDVSGDTIWLNLTFSEKAQAFAARDMKKLGITGAMLNADSSAATLARPSRSPPPPRHRPQRPPRNRPSRAAIPGTSDPLGGPGKVCSPLAAADSRRPPGRVRNPGGTRA